MFNFFTSKNVFYTRIGYSVRKNSEKIDVDFRRTGTLNQESYSFLWRSRTKINRTPAMTSSITCINQTAGPRTDAMIKIRNDKNSSN